MLDSSRQGALSYDDFKAAVPGNGAYVVVACLRAVLDTVAASECVCAWFLMTS
jgi:hypothetical protein